MTDAYAKWQALLRGESVPLHPSEPLCGFWRGRTSKTDPTLIGIAIWPQADGRLMALRNKREVDIDRVWPYCASRPISYETYQHWDRTGKWPDVDEAVTSPTIGHNAPPETELDELRDQIATAKEAITAYVVIDSDEQQVRAQTLHVRLLELKRQADNRRKALKAPHLEAGQAIDRDWQPLVKDATAGVVTLTKAMSAWETKKLRNERQKGTNGSPKATTIKGGYGRAASITMVKVVTAIDQDAVYEQFKTDPAVGYLLKSLAQKAVDAGISVEGVTVEEQRKVT